MLYSIHYTLGFQPNSNYSHSALFVITSLDQFTAHPRRLPALSSCQRNEAGSSNTLSIRRGKIGGSTPGHFHAEGKKCWTWIFRSSNAVTLEILMDMTIQMNEYKIVLEQFN